MLQILITHTPAQYVDAHCKFLQALAPQNQTCIAYGGNMQEFNNIAYTHKFFINDQSMRGKVTKQCYNEIFIKAYQVAKSLNLQALDLVYFIEYDHFILANNSSVAKGLAR